MSGTVTVDPTSNTILYDDVKAVRCMGGESQCYVQTADFMYNATPGQEWQGSFKVNSFINHLKMV